MDIIRAVEQQQINPEVASFNVGDTVKVHYRIKEGDRERIQVFQGERHPSSWCFESRDLHGSSRSASPVGVERTFPGSHSPGRRRSKSPVVVM